MPSFLTKRLNALRTGDAGKLSVLMFTAFIDMVGALMIIPLLPFYAKRFGASDFAVQYGLSNGVSMNTAARGTNSLCSDSDSATPTTHVTT